jgi:hypothetical protein
MRFLRLVLDFITSDRRRNWDAGETAKVTVAEIQRNK